jgi:hypothetical protein
VEQVQETISIPSQSNTVPFRRSSYLRFVFILFSSLALTNIGVVILAQSILPAHSAPNPFIEYMDIFPGQPTGTLEARGFSCWSDYDHYATFERICNLRLTSGVFVNIDIFILDDTIRQIKFLIRENTFKVGDLVVMFNSPTFHTSPHKVFFLWSHLFVNISTSDRRNTASMRRVWSVSFANI